MISEGTFAIQMTAEPPYSAEDGVTLARCSFTKQFTGGLDATSELQMLGARTPVPDSAGYVAIERVVGTLDGKPGTFILQHRGVMTRGRLELSVTVVPDSATGGLRGLRGAMTIDATGGKHAYRFEYELTPE